MTDRDSGLIEIMARAYAERNDFDWESPGHGQAYYLGHARAALSALREAGVMVERPHMTATRVLESRLRVEALEMARECRRLATLSDVRRVADMSAAFIEKHGGERA